MSMPSPARLKAVISKDNINQNQLAGSGALKKRCDADIMIIESKVVCNNVVSGGIMIMFIAGMPLVLYVLKIPASLDVTIGDGIPNIMLTRNENIIIEGINVSLNPG